MDYNKLRAYQKKWYNKQKTYGIVYCVYVEGAEEVYIGSTTNSLNKRLWQHKAKDCTKAMKAYKTKYGENIKIKPLWESDKPIPEKTLRELEQAFIDACERAVNKTWAIAKDKNKHCSKGGIRFNEEWFPTKLKLWEKYGKVPYGTFKSRQFHGHTISHALGLD